MLTKKQKEQQVEIGKQLLEESRNLAFIDFTGIRVADMWMLKKKLSELGAKLKVVKKKLMRIAFEKQGIDFNPEQFESQVGIIFTAKDISDIASLLYKFAKEKERQGFKILGAYDLLAKNFLDAETVIKIGQLPSKEILLSQLVGILSAPIRMLMDVIQERAKKVG